MDDAVTDSRGRAGGFTLIELGLVMFIITIVLALALPRFVPMIAFSELEGSARRIAGYGRSLVAHCAMVREPVTFRIDMDAGEYWSLRWLPDEDEGLFEDGDLFDEGAFATRSGSERGAYNPNQYMDAAQEDALRGEELAIQFERFVRMATTAKARNVPGDGLFDDLDPLFEKEFSLDTDEEESLEELKTALLERGTLPEGVRFAVIEVGPRAYASGLVEIDVTPLGLTEAIEFTLENERGDRYVVAWDAITGGARIAQAPRAEAGS